MIIYNNKKSFMQVIGQSTHCFFRIFFLLLPICFIKITLLMGFQSFQSEGLYALIKAYPDFANSKIFLHFFYYYRPFIYFSFYEFLVFIQFAAVTCLVSLLLKKEPFLFKNLSHKVFKVLKNGFVALLFTAIFIRSPLYFKILFNILPKTTLSNSSIFLIGICGFLLFLACLSFCFALHSKIFNAKNTSKAFYKSYQITRSSKGDVLNFLLFSVPFIYFTSFLLPPFILPILPSCFSFSALFYITTYLIATTFAEMVFCLLPIILLFLYLNLDATMQKKLSS